MSDSSQFSEREKEVTELLMQGKSNKQIALALGISASTVEYHLKNVYKKLQVNSRTEAVLRLGKSTGGKVTGKLGKSTVELNGKAADNGVQPVSTWRFPVSKGFVIIGSGLLAVACIVVLVLDNLPVKSVENVPTNVSLPSELTIPSVVENTPSNGSSLPDLVISSIYVSMVDFNGWCLPYYGVNVTVYNRGNASAADVTLTDINTGQEVQVGTLDPLQGMSMSFVAKAVSESYTVVADLHDTILESNEANNSGSFSEATATPVASCPPFPSGADTPTPFASMTLAVTDIPSPTHTVVPTADLSTLPDLIIKFTYLEMAGRQRNCVEAYAPYEIRVVVQNIGLAEAGPFTVDLNDMRQQVNGGLAHGQSIVLHFTGTTPSGQYAVRVDSLDQVGERDENNNARTYFAPTPTPPLLCTATPTPTQ